MLDLQFICQNAEAVAENCRNRNISIDLNTILALSEQRSALIAEGDQLRHQQKTISAQIPKASAEERPALIEQGKQFREQISANEDQLKALLAKLSEEQMKIPNMTHPDAPVGATEKESSVLREVGSKPDFDFTPLDHVDLMEKNDLLDMESGAKVAGHGFYYLKNEAVLLELALVQFAMEVLQKKGFTLYTTPDLARDEILLGIGFQPRGPETQIYSVQETDLSLVATAEITLGGALKDQILNTEDLPLRIAGLSHCFRTEAGAHGRATRGIYRVHQFTKVEIFGFTNPSLEASNQFHDEILAIEEEIFQALEVPYRVIDTATGDLGGPAYRKFDLEAWMPGRGESGEFGEITSTSNCTDYQSRRLKIRCKAKDQKGTQFVHTLNGTAVASTRAMIAILENHQQADGSIRIPQVLQSRMGMEQIG